MIASKKIIPNTVRSASTYLQRHLNHPQRVCVNPSSITNPVASTVNNTPVFRQGLMMSTSTASEDPVTFPVTATIRQKLQEAFQPTHLDVINESAKHNVPKDSETHFKVIVVSSQFDTVKSPLQRHRLINTTLSDELDGPVHALSIVAKSPAQWEKNSNVPVTPNCRGGGTDA